MVREYVSIERRELEARLLAERQIDMIKASLGQSLAAIAEQRQPLFAGLKAWWEAGGAAEVAGRKRSAELANATIGIRKTPPAVKLARGVTVASLIEWLGMVVGGSAFLRSKPQLDKQAIIKAMQTAAPMAGPLGEKGVSIQQLDEFFIDCGLDEDALKKEIAAS